MSLKLFQPFELIFIYRQLQLWSGGLKRKEWKLSEDNRISYWDGGSGTPVILVHGLGGSILQDFGPAATYLARKHRVLCFDLPGFGLSHQLPFEQSIANQTEFLRRFMDHVGIQKAHIIGNSMGGWISLKFAHQYPERIQKLVLVASAGVLFEPPPLDVFTPESEEGIIRMLSYLKMNPPKLPKWFLRDWLRHSMERRHSVRSMLASMLSGKDLMDSYMEKIQTPTLMLWGESDRIIPVEAGHRMKKLIPNGCLETYPNRGHLLFHEVFSEIMPRIDKWLSDPLSGSKPHF